MSPHYIQREMSAYCMVTRGNDVISVNSAGPPRSELGGLHT